MEEQNNPDLNIDLDKLKNHYDYCKLREQMGRIEIKMAGKNEECKHNLRR